MITITLNGRSVPVTRDVAAKQIATAEAAIAAMTPVASQAHNRFSGDAEIAQAQARQDAKRAELLSLISACRAALEGADNV